MHNENPGQGLCVQSSDEQRAIGEHTAIANIPGYIVVEEPCHAD
jgi:hypothetical protein